MKRASTPSPKPTQLLLKDFDPDLRRRAKVVAIRSGITLKAWATEALRKAVEQAERAQA